MTTTTTGNAGVADCLLTAEEAARLLAVRVEWVYAHVQSGYLPCIRLGSLVRFSLADLEEWLMERLEGHPVDKVHDSSTLLSASEVADYLAVSASWVYEARRSKGLPCFKLDGLVRFSRPLVEQWARELSDPLEIGH